MARQSVCHTIVEQVAEAEDVDPVELNPPLGDVVDPDALELLCESSDDAVRVEFEYCGYDVTVYGENDILVRQQPTVQ
jgi:hypothetical protein